MQSIKCFLKVDDVRAVTVDEWNQPVAALPSLSRGVQAELDLTLLDARGNAYNDPTVAACSVWSFAIANDWNVNTPPLILCSSGITVEGNRIRIPLEEMNTEELAAALRNQEQAVLGCELVGRESGQALASFILQFDVAVRNRRHMNPGELPTPAGGLRLPDLIPTPPPAFTGDESVNRLFEQVAEITKILRGEG